MPLEAFGAILGPLFSALLALCQERKRPPVRGQRSAWYRRRRTPRRYIRTAARVTARAEVLTR